MTLQVVAVVALQGMALQVVAVVALQGMALQVAALHQVILQATTRNIQPQLKLMLRRIVHCRKDLVRTELLVKHQE